MILRTFIKLGQATNKMQAPLQPQSSLSLHRNTYVNQHSEDELQYFKFGRERGRLRSYVQSQLDGQQVRKNQQILLRFQQQAQIRRHHYLPKFIAETHNEGQKARNQYNWYSQNAQMLNPQVEIPQNSVSYKHKFANYVHDDKQNSRQRQKSPLVASQKTKPPVYNYYNVLPYRSFDRYAHPTQNYHSKTLEMPKAKKLVSSDKQLLKILPQHSRALSLEADQFLIVNHREWALKKIKQAAMRKKEQIGRQRQQTKCSSGSELAAQLQRIQKQKRVQCEQLARRLKRLKKYRRYIGEQQKHIIN